MLKWMDAVSNFEVGDWVVYRKTKFSEHPGPRAQNVEPSPRGEQYSYVVEKYWVVTEVSDTEVKLKTRTGKLNSIRRGDPNLRKANWFERIFRRDRFPVPDGK